VDLDVVFLGTSGSAPTARRAPSALLLRHGGDKLLVDCGEGTQRQLLRSDVGLLDLEEIFLTHLHADHYLGLPGMLKTFSLRGRETVLTVHGPVGTKELVSDLRRVFGKLTYPLRLVELEPGDVVPCGGCRLRAIETDHGVVSVGYVLEEDVRPGRFDLDAANRLGVPDGRERGALQRGEAVTLADGSIVRPDDVLGEKRRGRRIVLSGDTRPCNTVRDASAGADLLVHEATFLSDERGRARDTGHSTAAEAAALAAEAGVGLLALTHLSARYGGREVEAEARELFPDTVVPRDYDVIAVPFPERGRPELVRKGARQAGELPAS
jgi:ribonuclease Z